MPHAEAVVIIVQASDEGRLFGSVMPKDISNKLSETSGEDIKKSQIVLAKTIRETGLYEAKVRIHADYLADIKVNVARNEEEAKENLKPKKEAVAETQEESSEAQTAEQADKQEEAVPEAAEA